MLGNAGHTMHDTDSNLRKILDIYKHGIRLTILPDAFPLAKLSHRIITIHLYSIFEIDIYLNVSAY